MSKFLIVLGIALAGLTACGGNPTGKGETVGTVGGAAVGGIIGHEAGRRYDERNK